MNKDLYTGDFIKGKRKSDRELSLFQNRANMLAYIKENPDKAVEVMYKLFENRKLQKGLTCAPSTVELRSSILPTVTLLNKYGIDYSELCDKVGLINKFDYKQQLSFSSNEIEFWQDTREQKPLPLKNSKVVSLSFGDYISPQNPSIAIERKSDVDLTSSISQGYERLEREIERAAENDVYIFILVERNLTKMLSFNYMPHFRFTQATPDYIFNKIRLLCQKYNNFQIAFCEDRAYMINIMYKICQYKGNPSSLDWQYLIDNKLV